MATQIRRSGSKPADRDVYARCIALQDFANQFYSPFRLNKDSDIPRACNSSAVRWEARPSSLLKVMIFLPLQSIAMFIVVFMHVNLFEQSFPHQHYV